MIPLIIWFYMNENYSVAVIVLILSGFTDMADGLIARKFNMISNLGKILDPIADKLTQGIVIICLSLKHTHMISLVFLFAIKELCLGIMSGLAIHKQKCVNSSKWYGKMNTVILYASIVALILCPDISDSLSTTLISLCGVSIIASFVLYIRYYVEIFKTK